MRRTILVVEDSQPCASTIEITLQSIRGIEVVQAPSGLHALEYLSKSESAAVGALITDLNMPVMDGFELIRRVRSNLRYARLPIIVLSGDSDPGTPERIRQLGADAYFVKPYSPSEVRNRIEELVNGYHSEAR